MRTAGLLPDTEVSLATMGIAFNTHAWVYMIASGVSAGASTRVSNSLGANRPEVAALSTKVRLGAYLFKIKQSRTLYNGGNLLIAKPRFISLQHC